MADAYEAALGDEAIRPVLALCRRFAGLLRRRLHHEDVVAIETIDDRGPRKRQHVGALAGRDRQIGEHAGQKLAAWIGELGPRGHVARFGAHSSIDGGDFSCEAASGKGVDGHADLLADGEGAQRLLWRRKVGVDRIEPLQGHEAHADRDILSEVDVAQA